MRLAGPFGEREDLRNSLKRMYERRSKFVHDGVYTGDEIDRFDAISLTKRLIAAEMDML